MNTKKLIKLQQELNKKVLFFSSEIGFNTDEQEIYVYLTNQTTQQMGDYSTVILKYKEDTTIEQYIQQVNSAIMSEKFENTHIATSTEGFILNLFLDYGMDMFVRGGDIYGDKIENGYIPLDCISRVDFNEKTDTLTLYDQDPDIHSHIINLITQEYTCISQQGIEEDRVERLEEMIDFLVDARPFDAEFKLEDGKLLSKFEGDEDFGSFGRIDEIDEITVECGVIGVHYKKDSEASEHDVDCLIINEYGVEA